MLRTKHLVSIFLMLVFLTTCTFGEKGKNVADDMELPQSLPFNSGWMIVIGEKPSTIEKTTAQELQGYLKRQLDIELPIITPSQFQGERGFIIGTGESNSIIASLSWKGVLKISEKDPGKQGFHLKSIKENVYVAGVDPVGVIYGVFHLEDAISGWFPAEALGQSLATLDMCRAPFFKERWGEHYNQAPPLDYTDEEAARWYSRHYFSHFNTFVWLQGKRVFEPETLEKYGVQSSIVQSEIRVATQEWIAEHPEVASLGGFHQPLVLCFRTDLGRKKYAEWFRQKMAEKPWINRWTFQFADLNHICGKDCPRCGSDPFVMRVLEIVTYLNDIGKKVNPDCKVICRTWGFAPKEMLTAYTQAPKGIGFMQKEPHDNDVNLLGREITPAWHPRHKYLKPYGDVYMQAGKLRGEDFYPAVGMGDSDEVTCPVVGMQLPYIVGDKMRRLAELGMRNFYIWFGGCHPWVYSVNLEVMRELIFDPYQNVDALVGRIAERDFGPKARDQVIRTWKAIDRALASFPLISNQRYQFYCKQMSKQYFLPLRPDIVLEDPNLKQFNQLDLVRMAELNYAMMVARLDKAIDDAAKVVSLTEGSAYQRARDQLVWLKLMTNIIKMDYNVFVRQTLLDDKLRNQGIARGTAEYRRKFEPLVREEMENASEAIDIIEEIPFDNFNISVYLENTYEIDEKSKERDLERIKRKIQLMQDYLDGLPNPYIKSWLLLGPIAYKEGTSGATMLDKDLLGIEQLVDPKVGEKAGELRWQEIQSAGPEVNLNDWIKPRIVDMTAGFAQVVDEAKTAIPLSNQVAYAFTTLESDHEVEDARMYISSDDQVKVWLNGNEIYSFDEARWWDRDRDCVKGLILNKGANRLLVKTINETGNWMFVLRFTDRDGRSISGLHVKP